MNNFNKLIKGAGVFLLYILVPYVINMFLPSITKSNTTELIIRLTLMFLLLLFFILLYKDDIIRDIKAFKKTFLSIIGKSIIYFAILIAGFGIISALLLIVYPDFMYTNSSIIDSHNLFRYNIWSIPSRVSCNNFKWIIYHNTIRIRGNNIKYIIRKNR